MYSIYLISPDFTWADSVRIFSPVSDFIHTESSVAENENILVRISQENILNFIHNRYFDILELHFWIAIRTAF